MARVIDTVAAPTMMPMARKTGRRRARSRRHGTRWPPRR